MLLILAAPLVGQNQTRVAFDVASVRVVEKPTPPRRTMTADRVDLVSYTIRDIIMMAYEVPSYRVIGPDWLRASPQWVEIHGTLPSGATLKQLPAMLRTLLAERFEMVAHVEPRPMDVGELTIGPDGVKMREVGAADDRQKPYPDMKGPNGSPALDTMVGSESQERMLLALDGTLRLITADTNYERKDSGRGSTLYDATRVRMAQLVDMVSSSLGKPVIDNTGLTGLYQFQIELPINPAFASNDPVAASPYKSVEALGLKLRDRRLPIDVLVVDKLAKAPTPN
jgi:uncharacterized protein (TIGR03435 family)